MPKICYVERNFSPATLEIIRKAEELATDYANQGYDLTLRQLYYQFVARGWLANKDTEYKRLGSIVSDARRAGLIDWDHIVDRTRHLRTQDAWDGPAQIVGACASQFDVDFWKDQVYRPEMWIEKDALVGVLEQACEEWQVPYFSCRGYVSDSEAWGAARRLRVYKRDGYTPIVFHLGDHDPSGIDMTRDIRDRLAMFSGHDIEVRRIALTMAQIEEVNPPPNPAKITDSRFTQYQELYGDESWELDALDPAYINNLVAEHIRELIDQQHWDASIAAREEGRAELRNVSENWVSCTDYLDGME